MTEDATRYQIPPLTVEEAREALHVAVDNAAASIAVERQWVHLAALDIANCQTDEQTHARLLGFDQVHAEAERARQEQVRCFDVYIQMLGQRLIDTHLEPPAPEGRIFAHVTTTESVGLNLSLHRAEADTCTHTGCWKKLAHSDDYGKDDTSWCSDCERAFYPEAQP